MRLWNGGLAAGQSCKHAMNEPLSFAIAVEPQLFAACVAADKIIATDVIAVPPSGLDAFRPRLELELCRCRIDAERTGHGEQPKWTRRQHIDIVFSRRHGARKHGSFAPGALGTVIGLASERV